MEKLTQTAKKLDKFIKILLVIMIIASVIIAIGSAAWLYILNSDMPVEMSSALTLGSVQFLLTEDFLPSRSAIFVHYFSSLLTGLISFVLIGIRLQLIRNILKPMKEVQPFHSTVSRNLKKLGWIEIICGICINICTIVQTLSMKNGYDLQGIFIGESISHITFNMTFDLTFVVIACALFLASYIFSYGQQLQQLSDETL